MTATLCRQVAYRGRDDTQTLNSTTFNYNQNTDWTQDVDTTFRVRLELEEVNNKNFVFSGYIEAQLNAGSWFQVTTSSTVLKAVVSNQFNQGDATTDVLTISGQTFTAGQGSEDGTTNTPSSMSNLQTEHEFALQIVGTDVNNNDTIQIRYNGLTSYTVTPSITVNKVTWIPASDSQSAYTDGALSASDIQNAFTKGGLVSTDNISAFVNGAVGVSDIQNAYTHGKDSALDNQSAFVHGGASASDVQTAYTEGKGGASDTQNAFTQGKDFGLDTISAYVNGSLGASDVIHAYVSGISTALDNIPAFTTGSLGLSDLINAFTQGQSDALDSISAFVEGALSSNDFIHAYTEGYVSGGSVSDSHSAFVLGIDSVLYPDADITISGVWKNELGQQTNLYQSIDEYPTANDADYIYHTDPISGEYYEGSLSNPLGNVGDEDVVVLWRGRDKSGSGNSKAHVEIKQGNTIIASGEQILTATPHTYYFTLTSGEKASITDWNDLRIRITIIIL